MFAFLRGWQERRVLRRLDVHAERDIRGFVGYVFLYQILTSAASLRGYGRYLLGVSRRWK